MVAVQHHIGGPTTAFIPVVFVVIRKFGFGGLILCMLLTGLMLIGARLSASRMTVAPHLFAVCA